MERIQIYPLRCGTVSAPLEIFETRLKGKASIAVWAFLIRHPTHGLAVFDTGLHPSFNNTTLGGVFEMKVPPGHDIASRLGAIDVDANEVRKAILSHWHIDHVGALSLLQNADLIVQSAEIEEVMREAPASPRRAVLELGHKRILVKGAHDLFGDGSVELFPTPGHTCGHQSLRVRGDDGSVILAGDACYFCASIETNAEQPHAWDRERYFQSLSSLRRMAEEGATIIPGHDESWLRAEQVGRKLVITAAASTAERSFAHEVGGA